MIKLLSIFCTFCLGFVIYSQTFHHSFQFDDFLFIVNNPAIRDVTDIQAIWAILGQPSRFVAFYSFALNYHFHQLDVFGYHAVNFVIHWINAVLVGWLVSLVVSVIQQPKTHPGGLHAQTPGVCFGLFAALIFIAHPVQTQAVTYITQRFASLATLFYLLSVCWYIKGRINVDRRMWYWAGACVAGILGMFTKEIVITLPLMIILVEYFLKPQTHPGGVRTHTPGVCLRFGLLLFFLVIPAIFSFDIQGMLLGPKDSASHGGDVITLGPYVLTQFRVMARFVQLCFLPVGQNVDYDFALSAHFFEPQVMWGVGMYGMFLAVAVRLTVSSRQDIYRRLIAFGIFWFLLTLAPNFIPRRHIIFEHKLYLPLVGFSLALSAGLYYWIDHKWKYITVMSIIVIVLSWLTYQRNQVWQTPITLWEDTARKSPHKPRPYNHLGSAYYQAGLYDAALGQYTKALRLNPNYVEVYINRALAYQAKGQYDLAVEDVQKGLDLNPLNPKAYNVQGLILGTHGKIESAIVAYNNALALDPDNAPALANRGAMYDQQHQYDLALADYTQALTLQGNIERDRIYNNRGVIYETRQQYDLALENYTRALNFNPQYVKAYANRGRFYVKQEQYDLALADYTQALTLEGNIERQRLYNNRGAVYARQKKYVLALSDYDQSLRINPQQPRIYHQRSLIHAALGHDMREAH